MRGAQAPRRPEVLLRLQLRCHALLLRLRCHAPLLRLGCHALLLQLRCHVLLLQLWCHALQHALLLLLRSQALQQWSHALLLQLWRHALQHALLLQLWRHALQHALLLRLRCQALQQWCHALLLQPWRHALLVLQLMEEHVQRRRCLLTSWLTMDFNCHPPLLLHRLHYPPLHLILLPLLLLPLLAMSWVILLLGWRRGRQLLVRVLYEQCRCLLQGQPQALVRADGVMLLGLTHCRLP